MKHNTPGLNSWQHTTNHNRMIRLQQKPRVLGAQEQRDVQLAFFGSSAFQIETPLGLKIMLDPWRNHPSRRWDWYFADFPLTQVDIGVSTHAHFDHDALHRLDASVLLDRLIGSYQFGDVHITGIADKHATDSNDALYDFKRIIREFDGIDITPPGNPRSWDNCLIIIETGGLRILHWGDNRHNPPEDVWQALGNIDVLLIPTDDSQHVLSFEAVESIIQRVNPSVVVPHHYYIWDVVQRQSTLQSADRWLSSQKSEIVNTTGATENLSALLPAAGTAGQRRILYFGEHVGFDAGNWRKSEV